MSKNPHDHKKDDFDIREVSDDNLVDIEDESTSEHASKDANKLAKIIDQLNAQVESSKKEVLEAKDKALRLHAEMENLRKRTERDVENAHRFALEKCLKDLIPVIDSMEHACQVQVDNEQTKSMRDGVELTMKMLVDTLTKYGVEQINPEGEPFDPSLHEAMSMQENQRVEPNTVITVLQKGYCLNDRVIRPARVIVSKR